MSELVKFYEKSTNSNHALQEKSIISKRNQTTFSTNYLPIKDQVLLILHKNVTIFIRNTKSLIAIFLSPIIFLYILLALKYINENYKTDIIIKEQKINYIDDVSLKCGFPIDCLSLGIAIIGLPSIKQRHELSQIIQNLVSETKLTLNSDIKYVTPFNTSSNLNEVYSYLVDNSNKTQYVLTFCYDTYKLGNVEIPCLPENYYNKYFHLYTIMYNLTNSPNGFFGSSHTPLPQDLKLLKLKISIDNSIIKFHSERKESKHVPRINNITSQGYPSVLNRFVKNADVISVFCVFYLFFPQVIVFCIVLIELVREKELSLKKYMILYGLSKLSYWLSWLIISTILCGIVSIELVFFGRYLGFIVFKNSNPLVPFLIFFAFGMNMQFLAYFLSCVIDNQNTANTVSYSIVLIGLVMQCIFTSYSLIYLLYSVNQKFIYRLIRIAFHFYPPFLFSKCFTDLSRISSYHFDQISLKWEEGDYYGLDEFFKRTIGKLRVGISYEVDSCFETFLWFLFLNIFFTLLIGFFEIKESYNESDEFFKKINFCNNLVDNYTEINKQKQFLDKMINDIDIDKLGKDDLKINYKETKINVEKNKTVINEKKSVIKNNKENSIPSGLRVLNLSKTFASKGLKALDNVYLEIQKNEILTILGPNGAGKSTLINILTCQLSSNEGFAKIGPFIIRNEFVIDSLYIKRIIGVCSQFDYLWEELTIYEHLYLYSKLRGIKQEKIDNYINLKSQEVRLEKMLNHKISSLSGGMNRRLSICISTLGDPYVIFMDEPTSGLDPVNRRKIWSLINRLKKNRVIVLTTHLMEEADYLSDRIGIIIGGQLRFIGNSTELRTFDINKLRKFDDVEISLKKEFPCSKINFSSSGVCNIFIAKNEKEEMIKAFKLMKKNKEQFFNNLSSIFEYIKEVSVSQSNLENIFLEVKLIFNL